jgi:hypothetical protein
MEKEDRDMVMVVSIIKRVAILKEIGSIIK